MANLTKLTPKKKKLFLSLLRLTGNISYAASMIGMARQYLYELRDQDSEFKKQWKLALEAGIDSLEQEARRRAFSGVKRVKVTQRIDDRGAVIISRDVTTEYSDTLMIFLLKAARPEKYRENFKIEHGGKIKHQKVPKKKSVDLSRLSDEELNQLERLVESATPVRA